MSINPKHDFELISKLKKMEKKVICIITRVNELMGKHKTAYMYLSQKRVEDI